MISVVVPAVNEEEGIRTLHQRVMSAAFTWNEDYELIVVDDGSSDGTAAICEEIATQDPHLKLVGFSRNVGHPAAISAGLQHSVGDIVAVIDAGDFCVMRRTVVDALNSLPERSRFVRGLRT